MPQPFGPTTPVSPGPMISSVGSTKDLKPRSLSRVICKVRLALFDVPGGRLCELRKAQPSKGLTSCTGEKCVRGAKVLLVVEPGFCNRGGEF